MKPTNFIAGLVLATVAGAAQAIPNTLTGNGIVWSWFTGDLGSNTGSILLTADTTGSTLQTAPAVSYLNSFSFKLDGANFDISGTPAATTATNFDTLGNELSANGCSGGISGSACFEFASSPLTISDDGPVSITIDFKLLNGALLTDLLHLKVQWVTNSTCTNVYQGGNGPRAGDLLSCDFTKVGDLISQDFVSRGDDPENPDVRVPVPGTLLLIGLGMLGLGFARKKAA